MHQIHERFVTLTTNLRFQHIYLFQKKLCSCKIEPFNWTVPLQEKTHDLPVCIYVNMYVLESQWPFYPQYGYSMPINSLGNNSIVQK